MKPNFLDRRHQLSAAAIHDPRPFRTPDYERLADELRDAVVEPADRALAVSPEHFWACRTVGGHLTEASGHLEEGGHRHIGINRATRGKLEDIDALEQSTQVLESAKLRRTAKADFRVVAFDRAAVNIPQAARHRQNDADFCAIALVPLSTTLISNYEGNDDGADRSDCDPRLPVHCHSPTTDGVQRRQATGIDLHHSRITAQLRGGANG